MAALAHCAHVTTSTQKATPVIGRTCHERSLKRAHVPRARQACDGRGSLIPLRKGSCSHTPLQTQRPVISERPVCNERPLVRALSSNGNNGNRSTSDRTPPTADASPLTKAAWFATEAFGNVVGLFQSTDGDGDGDGDGEEDDDRESSSSSSTTRFSEPLSRDKAVEALRADYDRSYFVTGKMTTGIYAADCEFADPFVSFKGKMRFKQNVSNLGRFMEDVNLKILDWDESELRITATWRFSCVLSLPWRPILAASGQTDHFFDEQTGKIIKHIERWDISPADGVRQLFKPNPRLASMKKGP